MNKIRSEIAMSKRQARKQRRYKDYKGRSPFLSDRFIEWIVKMIFQAIIFVAFYTYEIGSIRRSFRGDPIGGTIAELLMILKYLLLSDIIAHFGGWLAKWLYLKATRHTGSKKKNNNWGRWIWEYLIYIGLRGLFYLIQAVAILNTLLNPFFSVLSYLLAWILVSILSILLAKIAATYIIAS